MKYKEKQTNGKYREEKILLVGTLVSMIVIFSVSHVIRSLLQ